MEILNIATKIGAPPAMIGCSILIIRFVFYKETQRVSIPLLSCLLLGMNFMSFWGALLMFPGTWTFGSKFWCNAQGFFVQLNSVVFIYNFIIAINYFLVIRFRINLQRHWLLINLIIWLFPLVTSIYIVVQDQIRPSGAWCWIGIEYPWERIVLFYVPLWLCVFLSFVTMGCLIYHVQMQASNKIVRPHLGVVHGFNYEKRLRNRVILQAALYCFVFGFSWVWGTVNRLYEFWTGESVAWLAFMHGLFSPLQGFLNSVVFYLPIFLVWCHKRKNPVTSQTKEEKMNRDLDILKSKFLSECQLDMMNRHIPSINLDIDNDMNVDIGNIASLASASEKIATDGQLGVLIVTSKGLWEGKSGKLFTGNDNNDIIPDDEMVIENCPSFHELGSDISVQFA